MDAGRQGVAGNSHCLPLRKGVKDEFSGHAFRVEGMPFLFDIKILFRKKVLVNNMAV
jgi:hypothetical protein